jgi:hypothetical protein
MAAGRNWLNILTGDVIYYPLKKKQYLQDRILYADR